MLFCAVMDTVRPLVGRLLAGFDVMYSKAKSARAHGSHSGSEIIGYNDFAHGHACRKLHVTIISLNVWHISVPKRKSFAVVSD